MTRVLVLAAHGSHLDPNASAPLFAHADRLRAAGGWDEVRTGSWKEEPSLSRCLDGVASADVTVVPLFISTGYFTETVVPREMRLDGRVTRLDGNVIRYTDPVGVHPALAGVVVERAQEAGARHGDGIAVLGHGTQRNPNSARNVYEQADRVRATSAFAAVEAVFLDQEPSMLRVLDIVPTQRVFVVPLFIADGWHVGQTIPADLGLDAPCLRPGGRSLVYTPAAGTHPAVADVVAALATEAAAW